jgi:hypothetical protein
MPRKSMQSRNSICKCGSNRKYKYCCGKAEYFSAQESMAKLQDDSYEINWMNISLLPELIESYLGFNFLNERVKNYDPLGKTTLEGIKYKKKFHPLHEYWKSLNECIVRSIESKRAAGSSCGVRSCVLPYRAAGSGLVFCLKRTKQDLILVLKGPLDV